MWLPSGGTLVIDRTEAMTVIDVNTGKFTGSGGNLEETVTRNNLEAAEEVVRQLRLRDVGGIIVIDFIDMVLEANRDLVLRRLTECLARDRTRHQVAEVTSLGLVQMTRKRVGGGLLEHFSTPCEHCRGRGVVVEIELSGGDNGRVDRSERDARRSRGGRGRHGEERGVERNGSRNEQRNEGHHDAAGRNGSRADAPAAPAPNGAAASVDVGAPAPVAEPAAAVVEEAPVRSDVPAVEEPDAPAVDAPVVETPVVEAPVATGRRTRRRGGAVTSEPAERPADAAADAVEEVVVERSVAENAAEARTVDPAEAAGGTAPGDTAAGDTAAGDTAAGDTAAGVDAAEEEPRPRARRRGRVTRTAGAPSATGAEAPVAAVVTVPSTPVGTVPSTPAATATPVEPVVPVAPAPQPEPVAATRPRRARRAASRPAGPPAEGAGEGAGDGAGDPA